MSDLISIYSLQKNLLCSAWQKGLKSDNVCARDNAVIIQSLSQTERDQTFEFELKAAWDNMS